MADQPEEEIYSSTVVTKVRTPRHHAKHEVVSWVIAAVQTVTLIVMVVYVALTWSIASSTKTATEAGTRTTKAQMAVTLIDKLYTDRVVQDILPLIFQHDLEFKNDNGNPVITDRHDAKMENLESKVNMTLNEFQILGHLYDLGVLEKKDLRGLRYEVIEIGRDKAVRDYIRFLNSTYQQSSRVIHPHFQNFKDIYMAFEEDSTERKQFETIPFPHVEL